MKPDDMQVIGDELAIRWPDGSEQFIRLDTLRRACPCAGCKGEVDVMGHLHKGPTMALTSQAFQLTRLLPVGGYGVQPVWGDGHSSGIYTYDFLRKSVPAA